MGKIFIADLQADIQRFLLDYKISIDTRFFEEFVLTEFLALSPENRSNSELYFDREGDVVKFHMPSVDFITYQRILERLEIPLSDVIVGRPVILSTAMVDKLLSSFKAYVQSIENSDKFNSYKVASMPILESMALKEINRAVVKLLNTLNDMARFDSRTEDEKALADLLMEFAGIYRFLGEQPQYYADLLKKVSKLNAFFESNSVLRERDDLMLNIDLLYDGLRNYKTYTRAPSAIAAVKFFCDAKVIFEANGYDVSKCDIVEETLLQMAGVTTVPQKMLYKPGSDKTRVVFQLTGISKDEAKAFVDFFKAHGDITAKLGSGHSSHASYVPDRAMHVVNECAVVSSSHFVRAEPVKPKDITYSIEVDGLVLYQKIFPLLKEKITASKAVTAAIVPPDAFYQPAIAGSSQGSSPAPAPGRG